MNLLLVYFVLPVSLKHSRPIIVEMISMYNINNIPSAVKGKDPCPEFM